MSNMSCYCPRNTWDTEKKRAEANQSHQQLDFSRSFFQISLGNTFHLSFSISLLGRLPSREIDISIKDRRGDDKRDRGTKNELRLP
jgi:hypothetical protein